MEVQHITKGSLPGPRRADASGLSKKMAELREFPLVTSTGVTGSVFRTARFLDRAQQNLVRLQDGREFEVSSSALHVQPDGSFLLEEQPSQPTARSEPAAARVEAAAAPADSEPVYREPLFGDDISVERVPVNRLIDSPPRVREEGDTTIVPVVEEVITVQKRLMLKEEVRITRKRTQVREPRTVMIDGSGQT
jgi:hypothetical protein